MAIDFLFLLWYNISDKETIESWCSLLVKKKTESQWHEDDLRTIENYRPLDDDFMRELFRNDLPLAQLVLRIITGIEDLELTKEETQYDLKRLLGSRSICLDVSGQTAREENSTLKYSELTVVQHLREQDTIQVR